LEELRLTEFLRLDEYEELGTLDTEGLYDVRFGPGVTLLLRVLILWELATLLALYLLGLVCIPISA